MFSVFIPKLLAHWDIEVKKGYKNYNTKGKRRVIIRWQGVPETRALAFYLGQCVRQLPVSARKRINYG